jgi:hypothetical protein
LLTAVPTTAPAKLPTLCPQQQQQQQHVVQQAPPYSAYPNPRSGGCRRTIT